MIFPPGGLTTIGGAGGGLASTSPPTKPPLPHPWGAPTYEACPPPPPCGPPQPILVSTCLELATWAPLVPGKFATHLSSPHLFTFKMLTMS